MISFLTEIRGDKREWKAMEARAHALPRDYRIVYREMKSHLWTSTSSDGSDIIALLEEVLGLFAASAAQGKRVVDVTGTDVAAFCHQLLRGTTSYLDLWWAPVNRRRASLDRDVATRLAD